MFSKLRSLHISSRPRIQLSLSLRRLSLFPTSPCQLRLR